MTMVNTFIKVSGWNYLAESEERKHGTGTTGSFSVGNADGGIMQLNNGSATVSGGIVVSIT